jgi:hypothetical protein
MFKSLRDSQNIGRWQHIHVIQNELKFKKNYDEKPVDLNPIESTIELLNVVITSLNV